MKLNQAAGSIDSSEVTRARAFSDGIAERSEVGYSGVSRQVLDKEDELVTKVAALRKELAAKGKDEDPERYANLSKNVQKAEQDLKSFVEMLWEKHKPYAAVKYPRPVTLKQSALQAQECVVIFDVSEEGVGVKLIKGKEIAETFFRKWKLTDLEKDVQKFRKSFEASPGESLKQKLKEFDPALASELYTRLLSRVLAEIPKGTPIIIIPDGILAELPFEALVVGGNATWKQAPWGEYPDGLSYLGDVYPVSYYQSITALTLARTLGKQTKTGDRILVVADPVYSMKDQRSQKAPSPKELSVKEKANSNLMVAIEESIGSGFGRLPLTGDLAANLGRMFSGQIDVHTGLDADKGSFLKSIAPRLGEYGSVVFACHGYFGTKIPGIMEPVLVLTTIPHGTDGFIKMTDVMGLKMNANIVALTACQTGLGKELSGEGVMSMGRAFQYAGARSVLMSLWSVAEKSSVQLVENFFRNLKERKGKLEVLKMAREEIRKGGFDHPFFWASFILVGEVN
jgi:CHAT domain-containing protein